MSQHPEMAYLEFDLVERLGEWVKLLDHNLDANDFVGRDVCVRIIHASEFIHYIPLTDITDAKNAIPNFWGAP